MTLRSEEIKALFDGSGRGLEIGPSHNPLMPKRDGHDVEILDYLDADGLRQKYGAAGVDVSAVEDVDYISDGRPMTEVIGCRGCYDWIVASHVIEHVPDLVAFLVDCENLLKPSGVLVLAIPDKRCCFDVLRPVSTIGQVMQAHLDRRRRPPPGVILDDIAYARRRDKSIGWTIDNREALNPVRTLDNSWNFYESSVTVDNYIDVHCWVFVPSSFSMIIRTLNVCNVIKLHDLVQVMGSGEIFAILQRGKSDMTDIGDLAIAAQKEEREVILAG